MKCNVDNIENFSKNLETKKIDYQDTSQSNIKNKIFLDFKKKLQNAQFLINSVQYKNQITLDQQEILAIQEAGKNPSNNFIRVQLQNKKEQYYAFFFDQYTNLIFIEQMKIIINGELFNQNYIIFTNYKTENNFTLQNQILISPSMLSVIDFCRRKGIIQELIQNQKFSTNIAMLKGSVAHSVFQQIICNPTKYQSILNQTEQLKDLTKVEITSITIEQIPKELIMILNDQFQSYLKEIIYLQNIDFLQFVREVLIVCINAIIWIDNYVAKKNPIFIQQGNNYNKQEYQIEILEWKYNEFELSSYNFGFKGFADVILRVRYKKNKSNDYQECIMPIEIKTGLQKNQYEQQIQIYLFLLQQKYHIQVSLGLLLYLNPLQNQVVESNIYQLNNILFQRNLLVSEIQELNNEENQFQYLPQINNLIKSEKTAQSKCERCDLQSICYGVNILSEGEYPNIQTNSYQDIQSKLQTKSKQYLNIMLRSLRQEQQANQIPEIIFRIVKINEEIDKMQSLDVVSEQNFKLSEINHIISNYFSDNQIKLYSTNLLNTITFYLKKTNLELDDQNNSNNFEVQIVNSQDQNYVIQLNLQLQQDNLQFDNQDSLIFKYYNRSIFKHLKYTILNLAINDSYLRKKETLILGIEPRFSSINSLTLNKQISLKQLELLKNNLNSEQYDAIKLSLLAEDFALIKGYPGTGKTYTIAHLLYLLQLANQKVLVCAFTHSAVDNLLEKFIEVFPDCQSTIVRLVSNKEKVSKTAQKFICNTNQIDENIIEKNKNKLIFFSTCYACTDLFQQMNYDYCIIEEASQIIEPLNIACILNSKVFILIGDYKQLNPLVKTKNELQKSLLQRLDEQYSQIGCSVSLTLQYRMNNQIVKISNTLIYNGELQISEKQQELTLKTKQRNFTEFEQQIYDQTRSVMFINVIKDEIFYAINIIKLLLEFGLQEEQLLILTPYNITRNSIQDKLIQQGLKSLNISTIDRSQGKDCDCVIVVCSSQEGKNNLLSEYSRINVACTRAKKKLIIIGNKNELVQHESLQKLIQLMIKENWILQGDDKFITKQE